MAAGTPVVPILIAGGPVVDNALAVTAAKPSLAQAPASPAGWSKERQAAEDPSATCSPWSLGEGSLDVAGLEA